MPKRRNTRYRGLVVSAAPPSAAVQATPERVGTPRERFRNGFRVGLGLAVPTFLLAVAFGAVSHAAGWGRLAPIVASAVVFSGSAQFAMLAALDGGGGLLTAVTAATLINGRFLPMGIAAAGSLRGGRLRRAVEGQAVVDASFVIAATGKGRFDRERLIGSTLAQYPAWILGTALGSILGPSPHVIDRVGLDVAFPAFYVLLLWDELAARRSSWPAVLAGGAIAGILVLWLPVGVAILCCTAAALLGLRAREAAAA